MSRYTIVVEDKKLEPLVAKVLGLLKSFPQIQWKQLGDSLVIGSKAHDESNQSLGERFEQLFQQWKKETLMTSNGDEIIGHPAYRKIIALGKQVVPFILIKLQEDPQHLFHALFKITGENPIHPSHAGQLAK
jgi:hypothetical protein